MLCNLFSVWLCLPPLASATIMIVLQLSNNYRSEAIKKWTVYQLEVSTLQNGHYILDSPSGFSNFLSLFLTHFGCAFPCAENDSVEWHFCHLVFNTPTCCLLSSHCLRCSTLFVG